MFGAGTENMHHPFQSPRAFGFLATAPCAPGFFQLILSAQAQQACICRGDAQGQRNSSGASVQPADGRVTGHRTESPSLMKCGPEGFACACACACAGAAVKRGPCSSASRLRLRGPPSPSLLPRSPKPERRSSSRVPPLLRAAAGPATAGLGPRQTFPPLN